MGVELPTESPVPAGLDETRGPLGEPHQELRASGEKPTPVPLPSNVFGFGAAIKVTGRTCVMAKGVREILRTADEGVAIRADAVVLDNAILQSPRAAIYSVAVSAHNRVPQPATFVPVGVQVMPRPAPDQNTRKQWADP